MKVLVVGSGGREHSICDALTRIGGSPVQIFCADGNAGISSIAETVSIKSDDIEGLLGFAQANEIDLTFVGGETALVAGIVDRFVQSGLRIVGPNADAARLEGSKVFSKRFMLSHGIPTAHFEVASSIAEAKDVLRREFADGGSVIKADGLAGGKGVMVCGSLDEALQAVENLESIAGRQACNQILIEERLEGREVSLLLFSDGKDFRVMPPVRDHKRLSDGDAGPNTGGMGTVCSDDLIDDDMMQLLRESVVQPTLEGASADGFPFKGVLFIGLMITPNGPMVLEYNVRFGDPETQSLMIRLETPLIDILKAIEGGTLGALEVNWRRGVSATVVLATHGYPHSPRKGDLIEGLESVEQTRDLKVFHAGTGRDDRGGFVTTGGRVLGVSSFGSDLDEALGRVYEAARQIRFEGMQYRKDIGR